MINSIKIVKVAVVLLIFVIGVSIGMHMDNTVDAKDIKITKYEYASEKFSVSSPSDIPVFISLLNKAGSEGWKFDHSQWGKYVIFCRVVSE